MTSFTQSDGECLVLTRKEGLLSAVAHDLKLRVGRWSVQIDRAQGTVSGRFDTGSLTVVNAMKDGRDSPGTLGRRDHGKIEKAIRDTVLHTKRHPEASFQSTSVSSDEDGSQLVAGELTLHGRTRAVSARVARQGERWTTDISLHQPDFGITPYSAMFGTLKVQPDVVVRLTVPATEV